MSATLNLFPARVPIGCATLPDGTQVDVLMTPEFVRALTALFHRVGGATAMDMGELTMLAELATLATPTGAAAPQMEMPVDHGAAMTAIMRRIESLEQALAGALNSRLAGVMRDLQQVAAIATFRDPCRVDWEHPGKIGAAKANSGTFTTLKASGQITSTVATGTAPFVVASQTLVTNLNAALLGGKNWSAPDTIGNVTPAPITGTLVTSKSTAEYGVVHQGGVSVGGKTYTGFMAGLVTAVANQSGGFGYVYDSVTPTASFFHLTPYGAAEGSKFKLDVLGNLNVSGGFGCNGKAAQAAYALGAAATDLASAITLANNLRTMAINNGTGS